jgi:hypothetical protein
MPVETAKYRCKNACSGTLAASFGDPVLCPGLMDTVPKHATLGRPDKSSCEMSVMRAARRNGSRRENVTSYKG